MRVGTRRPELISICLLCCALLTLPVSVADNSGHSKDPLDSWLNDFTDAQSVPQVGKGELVFLAQPPQSRVLHSINNITITASSLETGWVQVDQCYHGLDAVLQTEVIYRYREMRKLHIRNSTNIGQATARNQSVELTNVMQDASLCIQAEARILQQMDDGRFGLRNGPFHRRFLDGYFPLHVEFTVRYPFELLVFARSVPETQPGFTVESKQGLVTIDTWFAGALTIEIQFRHKKRAPMPAGS